MIRATLASLLLLKSALSECLQGCLKCNERDECLFCDFKSNFKIQGISCQAVTIQNCDLIDNSGNCLLCKDKFFLDKTTNKCVEMKSADLDPNCVINASASECQSCVAGFYAFEGKCKAVVKPISNCTLSDSVDPAKCLVCNTGFVLAPDRGSCFQVTPVESCAAYSVALCAACKSGFRLNANKYLEDLYQISNAASQFNLLTRVNYDAIGFEDQGPFGTCSKTLLENCAVFLETDKCKSCKEGFFLDAKAQCQPFPLEGIQNCAIYQSDKVCLECAKNFFPQSPTSCVAVALQPNCTDYNQRATSTICTACVKEFYLNSDNKCILRDASKEIFNCAATNPKADLCLNCTTGLIPTDDKLACLPEVAQCQTYEPTSKSSQLTICKKCKPGFFYEATPKKCTAGSVENCEIYKDTENKCLACKNGFYLAGEVCLKHNTLANCATYDLVTPHKCAICEGSFFLFEPETACNPVTEIEKCLVNESEANCAVCVDGYKVNTAKKCELITSPSFCLQVSGDACTKCIIGYFLDSGTCVLPTEVFSANCQANNADGIIAKAVLSCLHCKSNALPYNYKNSYICQSKNRFDQTKLVNNCLLYKIDAGNNYACTKCVETMVLRTDGSCAETCESAKVIKVAEVFNYVTPGSTSTDFDNFAVTRTRVCVSDTGFTGCTHISPDIFTHSTRTASEASYVCRKCASGFFKYIKASQVAGVDDPVATPNPKSPVGAFPGVGCKSNPTRNSLFAGIDFCEYYAEILTDEWGCVKCQFGFSGPVAAYGTGTIGYHIPACQKITTCDDSVSNILEGFVKQKAEVDKYKTVLGALYSCHVCLTAGAIPYLTITFAAGQLPKLSKFGLTSGLATFASGNGGWAVNCYQNTAATFGIAPDSNYKTVANCGLGIINAASAQNAAEADIETPTEGKVGVFCYACKPGFKATRIATDSMAPLMVSRCDAIPSCQSSTWFNGCSRCNPGFGYKYNAATRSVEFDVCELFTDGNCFAVDPSGVDKVCKYCKKGFNLNVDGICEAITAVRCSDVNFLFPKVFEVLYDQDQHATGLFLMPSGPGCSVCETDNLGLFVAGDTFYCTDSPYLQAQLFPAGTKIINNCLNFAMKTDNSGFKCLVCKAGYIPSDPGHCVEKNAVANCGQAKTSQQCSKCLSGYTVVNGLCVQKTIAKCLSYDESPSATQLACLVCEPGFFPTPILCQPGSVANCKVLSNAVTCTECLPSFVLLTIAQGKSYCFPMPDSLGCGTADSVSLLAKKFKCTSCRTRSVISTNINDFPKSLCLNFTSVSNCASHVYAPLLQDSTFACKACSNGFFLNATGCHSRNVTFRECLVYKVDQDQCAECVPGTFLDASAKSCIPFPTGIKGCRVYKSLTECSGCREGLVFNKTQCDPVPANSTIDKCIFYADLKTCVLCQQGFALGEGKCVVSQATNCLAYESKTACGSCYDRFGFKEENGVRSCVAIDDAKCLVYQPFFPFKCLTCAEEFYSLNGNCTAVTTVIDNCLEYDSASICRKCKPGSALHFNKTLCSKDPRVLALFDNNCEELRWVFNPTCSKCRPGFFFTDGSCTKCQNNTLESGCYNCNSKNQTLCYMCNTGFFQNKELKCTQVTAGANTNSNTTNATNQTTSSSFVERSLRVLWLVAGLVFIGVCR